MRETQCARRAALASVPLPEAAGPSIAMIIGDAPGNSRSEPGHHLEEARETRRDHRAVIDRDRAARGEAHDQEAHGDAVVEMGRDRAAARGLALAALDDEIVALDRVRDAAGRKARRDRRETIAFLDAQFAQAAHARLASREGRGDREHRIFVDHGGRARGRHVDAAKLARAHAQIGDLLAAFLARVQRLDVARPSRAAS